MPKTPVEGKLCRNRTLSQPLSQPLSKNSALDKGCDKVFDKGSASEFLAPALFSIA
jgi:hypothetical protein